MCTPLAEDFGCHLPRHVWRPTGADHLLLELALPAGGEGGARLAHASGLPSSPDTRLRLIRRQPEAPCPPPRVLGVDDVSLRRGHRDATLLVDLETQRPIDLVAGRAAADCQAWLRQHAGGARIVRARRRKRRSLRWVCLRPPAQLDPDERPALAPVLAAEPDLRTGYTVLQRFRLLVAQRDAGARDASLADAQASGQRCGPRQRHPGRSGRRGSRPIDALVQRADSRARRAHHATHAADGRPGQARSAAPPRPGRVTAED